MNYYVTKYALTQGIWVVDESCANVNGRYLYINPERGSSIQVRNGYWHRSLESAQEHVGKLVARRLKALEKSVTSLKNYRPNITTYGSEEA